MKGKYRESHTVDSSEASYPTPVVVDLGAQKRKRIRQLKKGKGPLVEEVHAVVQEVLASLGEDGAVSGVPVVMLYRRKSKKRKGLRALFG